MLSRPSTLRIVLLHYLTLGFYFFYWCSRSRAAVNRAAHTELVPTTWLLILPGGNFWWMWKYGQALQYVSFNRIKGSDTFLLYVLATYAWTLFDWPLRFGSHTSNASGHQIVTLLIVVLAVFYVVGIAGLAFFCSVVQQRINSVVQPNPTHA